MVDLKSAPVSTGRLFESVFRIVRDDLLYVENGELNKLFFFFS